MSEEIEEGKGSPGALPKRVVLNPADTDALGVEDYKNAWKSQDSYIDHLETQFRNLEGSLERIREDEEKLKQQYGESQHRERVLVRRLAAKEQEIQDFVNQIAELKASQATLSGRATPLDPAVNLLLLRLKRELAATRARLEETQNELSAWKFTPDSNTGKKLMAKCRLLHQENEELGRITSAGRLAKLEADLALQKGLSEEVKKTQSELDELLLELDEDVEGMQSTVLFLQQELKAAKEKPPANPHKQLNGDAHRDDESDSAFNGAKRKLTDKNRTSAGEPGPSDSDSECADADADADAPVERDAPKKRRRASVLSLDYNEEEDPLTATNGDAE